MDEEKLKKMFADQTAMIMAEINKTNLTLAPIAAIYESAAGFTKVTKYIFRATIIPVSVIIGIILSIKELITSHKIP